MANSVKEISAAKLESEIASLISGLTGKECTVHIGNIAYGHLGMSSDETIAFDIKATCSNKQRGEPMPF